MGIDFIFRYLNKERIKIDKDEFNLQFNSHPDYPSLLAISDTLRFFNVRNAAIKVETSEIALLPNRFIARLRDKEDQYLTFVEKKGDAYLYAASDDRDNTITADEFKTLFGNIVLLAENEEGSEQIKKRKTNLPLVFPFLIVLALVLYTNFQSYWSYLFYVFPIAGLLLCILASRELFNVNSTLFNKFCAITDTYDCNTVITSSKWKILDKINFSDLGITFFVFQLISLLAVSFSLDYAEYFFIQYVLLLISVPINLTSLYYQRFVEKKWCLICLSIIGILVLEFSYILIFNNLSDYSISYAEILKYIFLYLSVLTIWFPLKRILKKLVKLKEEELKYYRFKKNYQAFKNNLVSELKYDLPINPITLESKNSLLHITLITNPYCGSCAAAHKILHDIIEKDKGENISFSVIFNYDEKHFDAATKLLLGNIVNSKLISDVLFKKAIEDWFKYKNIPKWMQVYGKSLDDTITDSILKTHKDWCNENDIYFTPCVLINGYEYPSIYEISDLSYFVDELIGDSI